MEFSYFLHWVVLITLWLQYGECSKVCYSCDSMLGFSSSKACYAENPTSRSMNRLKVPDEDECYRCFKGIISQKNVKRGCIAKDEWESISEYFEEEEACSSNVPYKQSTYLEFCACTNSRCNQAVGITSSSLTIITAFAIKALTLVTFAK